MLKLNDIKVHYGRVEALHEVNLKVEDATLGALIGPNGAGKTTVIKAISGQKKLTAGEIWYQGQRIDKLRTAEIVELGISQVPEGRHVFPYMSVLDNLLLGAYKQKDKKLISQSLEEIYSHFPLLKERPNQQAGKLSGGEQQMLATARALMNQPKLLLMDEPTLGLSPILVKEVGRIAETIRNKGVTVLLIEQNAAMALRLANYAYVLEIGRVVLSGESQALRINEHVKRAYLGG